MSQVFIKNVFPDSPAAKSGLIAGDIIITVKASPDRTEIALVGKSMTEVLGMIRGPLGVPVGLRISRSGQEQTVSVQRGEVQTKRRG